MMYAVLFVIAWYGFIVLLAYLLGKTDDSRDV